MAERVRYYLERSVPELEDLKNKGLFEKNELTLIMRRRTDFEHRIQGRGQSPRDYLKYVEFELNLEKLRKKRFARLFKVGLVDTKPTVSDWAGPRRVLFIFERATRRFPRELDLWAHYLRYAKAQGAIKVIYNVYSKLLQLQPRNIDAWLSAAKYEFETNANANGARVLFQRGLRLNPELLELWLAYAQFELSYISRLLARRKVLGLITEKQQQEELEFESKQLANKLAKDVETGDAELNNDVIELPSTTELNEQLNTLPEADMNMLGNPETNPALRGDVALTVYDVCVPSVLKTVPETSTVVTRETKALEIANRFLTVFDDFTDLNREYLYTHVLNSLQETFPENAETMLIDITLPIRGITTKSSDMAERLQLAVKKLFAYKNKTQDSDLRARLTALFIDQVESQFLQEPSSVEDLLRAIIEKCKQ